VYRGVESRVSFLPKERLETELEDADLDKAISALTETAPVRSVTASTG
jgi:hypothetical protein